MNARRLNAPVPVGADADVDHQRHRQFGRPGHALAHAVADFLDMILMHLQHEFVVHLHEHACLRGAVEQPVVDGDHGALDDVRRGALHGALIAARSAPARWAALREWM